jgi:hypothetical protein
MAYERGDSLLPMHCLVRVQAAAFLRVCPEIWSRVTNHSEYSADRCEAKKGERIVVEVFPVLGKSATGVEQADRSLDNPALWQNDEALGPIAATHNCGYQARYGERQTVLKHWPCVRGVGKHLLERLTRIATAMPEV